MKQWAVDFRPLRARERVSERMFEVMYRAARRAFRRAGLKNWQALPIVPHGCECRVIGDIRLVVQYNVVRDEFQRRADVLVDA